MYCAAICNSCADACSAEDMSMKRCIRLCMDCSDVCTATYRVGMRRTDHNRQLIRSMLATCIEACDICRAECEKHDAAHCRRCAPMCQEWPGDCREALVALNEEVHGTACALACLSAGAAPPSRVAILRRSASADGRRGGGSSTPRPRE